MIRVKLYGPLREGLPREPLGVAGPTTVGVALLRLCQAHPGLRARLLDGRGRLLPHVVALVDGQNVWSRQGLDTSVPDLGTLVLLHPIEGG